MNVHAISMRGLRDQNEDAHVIIRNIDNKNKSINNIDFYAANLMEENLKLIQ